MSINPFANLKSYSDYLNKNPFHKKLGVNIENYGPVKQKIVRTSFYSVDPYLQEPISVELDDLIRLHYLVTSRKVMKILEFGVGKSSIVFDHALQINRQHHLDFVLKNLRQTNPFECFSVDNNQKWISVCRETSKTRFVNYHYSDCIISSFNGRICTFFENLPNVCPDLIYLDGPDQFSPHGDVKGISTRHAERVPMAADILTIEHFLMPGTLIVVDGRTANARFLKTNLQRNWSYLHSEKFDQHYFELIEPPLGNYNKMQVDFCLGEEFYDRIKK